MSKSPIKIIYNSKKIEEVSYIRFFMCPLEDILNSPERTASIRITANALMMISGKSYNK